MDIITTPDCVVLSISCDVVSDRIVELRRRVLATKMRTLTQIRNVGEDALAALLIELESESQCELSEAA